MSTTTLIAIVVLAALTVVVWLAPQRRRRGKLCHVVSVEGQSAYSSSSVSESESSTPSVQHDDWAIRMERHLERLDETIALADREIARLERLLEPTRHVPSAAARLSLQQQQTCFACLEEGWSVEQIAHHLRADREAVLAALDEWRSPHASAA